MLDRKSGPKKPMKPDNKSITFRKAAPPRQHDAAPKHGRPFFCDGNAIRRATFAIQEAGA